MHKEQFLQDLSQTQKINRFSEESQQLLADLNHTEIFELCENSAKQHCLDCNTFWEIGIIYCSCGGNLKYLRSPTTSLKNNCGFTSFRGLVIKKNSSRGAKHGPSERQAMYFRARQMLKKARQDKHGHHLAILSRWYAQEGYRMPSAEHNIGEPEIMHYDRIALERRRYTATKAERIQNTKHWVLCLNADGPQKTSLTATRIRRSSKRMPAITRRAPGGNPAELKTHPSQPTRSSKTRTTVRRR